MCCFDKIIASLFLSLKKTIILGSLALWSIPSCSISRMRLASQLQTCRDVVLSELLAK